MATPRRSLRRRVDHSGMDLVPGLLHIGHDEFSEARPVGPDPHRHPGAYEVCLTRRGSMRWRIGERSFLCGPDDLFMTLPDELHGGQRMVMERGELYWIGFALDPRHGAAGLDGTECAELDRRLRASPRTCHGNAGLVAHFDRILGEIAAQGRFSRAVIRSNLALLLTGFQACFDRAGAGSRIPSPRIQAVIDWMRGHLAEPLALDAIAAKAGLSTSQFRSVFRAETGFPPLGFLVRLRVERAQALLAQPRLSITRIAQETGFGTSQYFATIFRRSTGFTPRAWRNRTR